MMSPTLRVAHVTPTFPPHGGGTGNVCFYQARELARLGHDVTVLTGQPHHNGSHTALDGVKVRYLPSALRLGNAPLTPHLAGMRGFDLLHLHLPFIFGAELTWLASLRSGCPYLVTYHMDLNASDFRWPLFETYRRTVLPLLLHNAALIMPTTMDYALQSDLKSLLPDQRHRLLEVPNGVDTDLFRPGLDAACLRERYGLAESDRVILFVGCLDRAHYFKGVSILLRALTRLPANNIKALIVGDGDLKESYMRQAGRLGLGNRVQFCGHVRQDELPAHYAVADCLVLPSTGPGEAFGLVLLEAMACSKPVIASALPGVRAVVSDGGDGLLVQPGSADDLAIKIRLLLDDRELCQRLGAQGRRKVVAHYAWPVIGRRLAAAYEYALNGARSR